MKKTWNLVRNKEFTIRLPFGPKDKVLTLDLGEITINLNYVIYGAAVALAVYLWMTAK